MSTLGSRISLCVVTAVVTASLILTLLSTAHQHTSTRARFFWRPSYPFETTKPPILREFQEIPQFADPSANPAVFQYGSTGQSDEQQRLFEELALPSVQLLHVNSSAKRFGVTFLHQLHCIYLIRDEILKLKYPGKETLPHNHHHQPVESDHWAHCLAYLAQGIICNADDTLEPPVDAAEFEGKLLGIIDGTGTVRECHDTRATRHHLEQSESQPVQPWTYRQGDRLRDLFADLEA